MAKRAGLTVLAGGVGAAKFLRGLLRAADPSTVTVVVNTGDDERFYGLAVSPDLDTITYTAAGLAHRHTRWGVDGHAFECLPARPAPGVLAAIRDAQAVIIAPSNPFLSIGPILAVPGVRRALERRRGPVAAVSPLVAGRAPSGPLARQLRRFGMRPSALGIAAC